MLRGLHWNRGLGRAGGRKSQLGAAGGGGRWGLGHFICPLPLKRMSPSFLATQASVSPAIHWRLGVLSTRSTASGAGITLPTPHASVSPSVPRGWVSPPPSHTHSLGSWPRPPSSASVVPFVPRGWVPAARSPGSGRLRGLGPRPARPASRLRPGPPLGARHFLLGREKALPGGGDNSGRGMVALENPEGGSEEAVAAVGSAPGGRRTL